MELSAAIESFAVKFLDCLRDVYLPKLHTVTGFRPQIVLVERWEEQKLLLKDPKRVRTVQRWTRVNGERQATTRQQAVRP